MNESTKSRTILTRDSLRRKSLAIAVEITFGLALSNTALATTYYVTNLFDSGGGSLRQAIASADLDTAQPALVEFHAGLTGTITLTTGEIAITQPLNIQGPGAGVISVSGNGTSRVFNVQPAAAPYTATISGLTLENGYSGSTGGAVYVNSSRFAMNDCIVTNNVADTAGGGLAVYGNAQTALTNDTFSSNLAPEGCGFKVESALATITGVVSENNTCTLKGGGGETIASSTGGSKSRPSITITGSRFLNNEGGGLYSQNGTLVVGDSEFSGNYIASYGAGLSVSHVIQAKISSSTISGNYAIKGGGGLSVTNSQMVGVNHSTIDGNRVKPSSYSTGSYGGGIFMNDLTTGAIVAIQYSTISNNQSGNAAGIYLSSNYPLNMSLYDTTIAGNVAGDLCGAAELTAAGASTLIVESTTIASNSASKVGGIQTKISSTVFHDSIIANNTNEDLEGVVTGNFTLFGNVNRKFISGANNLFGVDPMLGPLGDYGGDIATMRPLSGSPVIDAGDPSYSANPTQDERGLPRVVGTIDMGAVEVQTLEDTIFVDGFESD